MPRRKGKNRPHQKKNKIYITKKKVCNDFAEIQLSKFLFVGVMQRSDGELEVRGEEHSVNWQLHFSCL